MAQERSFAVRFILPIIGVLIVIGVVALAWGGCGTAGVPPAGVPVPAGAIPVTGPPPAKGGGPIPAGATCLGGAGSTCSAPGSSCWVINTCTDTYHMTTGTCECRCI